jgi:hypothetical protein
MLFGGAIGARCRKDPETGGVWLAEGGQRPMHEAPAAGMRCLLLRKRAGLDRLRVYFETKPDRLTVLIDDLPIAARPFAPDALDFALPADALQRSTIRLVLNSTDEIRPAHFVFADAAGRNSFWIDCAAPPSPAPDIERALACPACWTVTARCRADLCGQPCLEKARDSLAVQQNRMTVRANAGDRPPAAVVHRRRRVVVPAMRSKICDDRRHHESAHPAREESAVVGAPAPGLKTLGYFLSPLTGRAADGRDELERYTVFYKTVRDESQ